MILVSPTTIASTEQGSNSDNADVNDAEEDTQAEPTVRLLDKESASFSLRTSATGNETGEQHFSGGYHSEMPNVDAKRDMYTNRACCKCKCCTIYTLTKTFCML